MFNSRHILLRDFSPSVIFWIIYESSIYNYILLFFFIQATGPETTASLLAAGLDARAAELVSQLFFFLFLWNQSGLSFQSGALFQF